MLIEEVEDLLGCFAETGNNILVPWEDPKTIRNLAVNIANIAMSIALKANSANSEQG